MDPDDTLLANVLRRLIDAHLYRFSAPYVDDDPYYDPPGPKLRAGEIGVEADVDLSQEEFDAIVRTGLVEEWLEEARG